MVGSLFFRQMNNEENMGNTLPKINEISVCGCVWYPCGTDGKFKELQNGEFKFKYVLDEKWRLVEVFHQNKICRKS